MWRSWRGLLVLVVGCELVGVVGALTTGTGSSPWYLALAKPSFQPPGWVFGPVWTLLYALMGIAAWRVVRRGTATPGVRRALVLFGVQLALNAAWSPVFFGAHAITAALVILVALWAVLLLTVLAFRPLDRPAAWLLVPYLAWTTFAAVLNGAIVALN
jgi:tryptophan-rich sensory protein